MTQCWLRWQVGKALVVLCLVHLLYHEISVPKSGLDNYYNCIQMNP